MLGTSGPKRSKTRGREQHEKPHKDLAHTMEEKKSQPRRMPTRVK